MTSIAGIKKGDKVTLLGFTGIVLSTDQEVFSATKTTLTLVRKNGTEMIFDKKTGLQTNLLPEKLKWASKVVHSDDTPDQKPREKKSPGESKPVPVPKKGTPAPAKVATPAKKTKKPVPVVEEIDDEEEEEEEEIIEVPKAKPASKSKAKKPAPVIVEEEEDDEEYEEEEVEEEEDDEFEEV